jgi:hypothetical protein
MLSTINNIGLFANKVSKLARGKAIMAAAVATLGLTGTSFGAFTDVTQITTKFTTGISTSVNNVPGYGASYSPFQPNTNWNVSYGGDTNAITSLVAGGQTYTTTGLATNAVRRFVGPDNDQLWYDGSYNTSTGAVSLQAPALNGFKQVFDANNVLVGADNLFSTEGNGVGNDTNVDRLDILFTGGVTASAAEAFSIMERGPSNDHDSFKIAAITALDSNGNPSNYGPLISVADGTWGKTDVVSPEQEVILREDNDVAGDTLHPSDETVQAIGGILVKTSDLVSSGTTIYGYSLFSADVTGSGTQLVNWTNSSYYHPADSSSTGGGLDPIAAVSNLYTLSPVPEPTSAAVLMLAGGAMLIRRRRNTAVQA